MNDYKLSSPNNGLNMGMLEMSMNFIKQIFIHNEQGVRKMKKVTLIAGIFALGLSSPVFAGDAIDWKVCAKEMKSFTCAGSDKDVWTCLEKNDEKLSKECQTAHVKGDALFKK